MIPPASNDYLNNSPFIPPSISGGKYADDNRKMNANSSSNAVYNRVRRSANYVVQPEISKSKSGRNEKVVNMVSFDTVIIIFISTIFNFRLNNY